MKISTCLALFISLLCLSAHAVVELQPYEAHYQTKAQGFTIKTVRTLEKKKSIYELRQITSTVMMQTQETSVFTINAQGGFLSRSFLYQRKILGNNKFRQTDFFPARKIATYLEKGEEKQSISIPEETYDVFNYQEKMRLDMQTSQGTFRNRPLHVLEKDHLREYNFKDTGSEWINTAVGYLDTIKIERIREAGSTKKTTVWLAKDWGYIIVKVLHQEENEADYQMNFVQGNIGQTPITGKKDLPKTTG